MRRLGAFAVLLALLIGALPARAQFIGYTSLQTSQQTLFPAGTACTGSPQFATITNVGQTGHQVTVIPTGFTSTQFYLQGSNDGLTFARMSDEVDGGNPASLTLSATGYYNVVRFVITCNAAGGTFSATYSGSGIPQSNPAGDGLLSQVEKILVRNTSAGTTQAGTYRVPYGNLSGLLFAVASGTGFPSGSTFSITCNLNIGNPVAQTFSLAASSALQQFNVAATPCVSATWTYTSGGASSNLIQFEHVVSAGFSGATGSGGGGCPDGSASCNPNVVAGITSPGSSIPGVARYFTALAENANDLSVGNLNVRGIAIGAGNLNPANNFTGMTAPNVGALATQGFGVVADQGTPTAAYLAETHNGGFTLGVTAPSTANNSPGGLLVDNNGYSALIASQTINANGTQAITTAAWNFGTFDSCYVTVTSGNPTGTAPTLDVEFQTSNDGTNFQDRIHFNQITTTAATQKQNAGISAHATNGTTALTAAVVNMTSGGGTVTAGQVVNGPIGGWLRFQWQIGGTTPSFPTVQFGVACH